MPCQKCDSTKLYQLDGTYHLLISPPPGHCYNKLYNCLVQNNHQVHQKEPRILQLIFLSDQAENIALSLQQCLTPIELEDCKAALLPETCLNRNIDQVLSYTHSLQKIVGLCLSQWLIELIKQNQLTTFCQPIIASKGLTTFGYECLLRGRIGDKIISAAEIFAAAKASDMVFLLDKQGRVSHIQNMSQVALNDQKIFINFIPTAIYDPLFCLRTTNQAIEASQMKPEQIVFEVTESDEVKDKAHLLRILTYYREQGYGVALDDLGSGYSSLNLLSELQPDYVKIDQHLIQQIHLNPFKEIILEKICEMANKLGIKIVCEGIETQEELDVIKKYPVDYYQGYLFQKPAPFEQLKVAGNHSP